MDATQEYKYQCFKGDNFAEHPEEAANTNAGNRFVKETPRGKE
jgi:hypothetical protein